MLLMLDRRVERSILANGGGTAFQDPFELNLTSGFP